MDELACLTQVGLILIAVAWIGKHLLFAHLGTEKIVPRVEEMSPFFVVERTRNKLVVSAKIPFVNEGKQCGVIMDALIHLRSPYAQHNISIWGKVELDGQPREDDYFEAMLIQKGERIHLAVKFCIAPCNGISLDEALEHLPDFQFDLIYQESGRISAHYSKVTLTLPHKALGG